MLLENLDQKLIEVKERLGHGNDLKWLESEFAWTDRTARNYTTVAKQFKSETISSAIKVSVVSNK